MEINVNGFFLQKPTCKSTWALMGSIIIKSLVQRDAIATVIMAGDIASGRKKPAKPGVLGRKGQYFNFRKLGTGGGVGKPIFVSFFLFIFFFLSI